MSTAHRRKGAYSSSSKKKSSSSSSSSSRPIADARHRSAASAAVRRGASSSASSSAASSSSSSHTPTYFPQNGDAIRAKASRPNTPHGGSTPAARSRATSISIDAINGDPFSVVRLRLGTLEPHMAAANIVLAAITDILRDRGLDSPTHAVNPTHYFGTLMVLIERQQSKSTLSAADNIDIGALIYLLAVLLPQLPIAVLKKHCDHIAGVLISLLGRHADDALIAKHVLECSAVLLAKTSLDAPAAMWLSSSSAASSSTSTSHGNVAKLIQVMLVYSLDHRPRIRRAGQEGVRNTLRGMYEHSVSVGGSSSSASSAPRIGVPKPVCDTVVSFCLREISQCTPKDCGIVLFLCGLLQSCIQYLSTNAAGQILEAILSMVGKGNSILMVQAMRTVDAFFLHATDVNTTPSASSSSSSSSAPTSSSRAREQYLRMSSQLLTVLLTLKPHQHDQLATGAYLNTLKISLVKFIDNMESGAGSHAEFSAIISASYEKIPELLTLIAEGLLSPKVDVVKGSSKAMGEILRKTLTKGMIEQSMREADHRASLAAPASAVAPVAGKHGKFAVVSASASASSVIAPPFYRVIALLESLLSYRYKVEWNRVLLLVAELFHSSFSLPRAQALLVPLLKQLDAIRFDSMNEIASEDPSADYRPALDEALGAAIQSFGPEAILSVLPLNLPMEFYTSQNPAPLHEQLSSSRSWLFPLFRSYIAHASIGFFLDFFAPIALGLFDLEKVAISQGKVMESKAFAGLAVGVWDIFPSLCSSLPTDLGTMTKPLVRELVERSLNVDAMKWNHAAIVKGLAGLVRKLKEVAESANSKKGKHEKAAAVEKDDEEEEKEKSDDEDDVFDDEDDDEDEAEDDDSDDDDAVARAKTKRKMKLEQVKKVALAAKSEALAKLASASSASASSHSSARRPPTYTARESAALLSGTISPLCKNLLPVLFNLAAMPHEKKEIIFDAIGLYASISDHELLNLTFKKVLRKLLEHTMAVTAKAEAKIAAKDAAARDGPPTSIDEDDEAAPVVSTSINSAAHADMQRAHMLTDIVYSLCSQSVQHLDSDNMTYLYTIVSNQLRDESIDGGLQKKFYKILSTTMLNYPGFIANQWTTLVADMSTWALTLQSAALKHRLACVRHILLHLPELMAKDKSAVGLLPGFLGEVILGSKEVAAKSRDVAFEILVALGKKMIKVQEDRDTDDDDIDEEQRPSMMAEYIYMIAGGLAGSSNHMQSASVLCLARMMYEFKLHLGSDIVSAVLSTVLPLFDSKSRELIKSLLAFIKVCLLTFDSPTLTHHLPAIIAGLVQWCDEKKQRFKIKIKILFEIMMKKCGVDEVRALVPDVHTKLIEHIRKSKEREKRQKTELWIANKKEKDDDMNDDASISQRSMQDYDSIMRDDTDNGDAAASSSSARNGAPKDKASGGAKSGKDINRMWIRDGDVDFMDPSVVSKVSATNPEHDAALNARRTIAYGAGVSKDDATGKMRITSDSASSKSAGGISQAAAAAMIDIDEIDQSLKQKQRDKRKRDDSMDDGTDDASSTPAVKRQQMPGSQYRSTKAGGDMKRKGQMDPYAFVPLDPMAMNKRKKFTSQRRLESIVTAAKAGSRMGSKAANASTVAKGRRGHTNKKHRK